MNQITLFNPYRVLVKLYKHVTKISLPAFVCGGADRMLHKLKGRFLSTARFYTYEDLNSFVKSIMGEYGREGVIRFQVFLDDTPYIVLLYVSLSDPCVRTLVYDAHRETLLSNVSLDNLRSLLSGPGQVEAYFLRKNEFDVDMEIIDFRATVDNSLNYLLMLDIKELLPQVGLEDAEEPRVTSDSASAQSSTHRVATEGDPLYSLLEEMVNNELSKVVEDPMFLARVLMNSRNPVVSRVPSSDAKSLIANVIRTSRNRMLTCMFGDGSLCHIYINKSRSVGLCVTNGEGNKVCGRDALKFLRKIEDNVQKIASNSFTTVMMYDLET